MSDIASIFTNNGGIFCSSVVDLQHRVLQLKAFLFDWDGVFNDGSKTWDSGSSFNEPDSMGINMLRFGYWLRTKHLPAVAILSGEDNATATYLTEREHFTAAYHKSSHKVFAFEHFLKSNGLQPREVAFVFDDVLDLSVAEKCGVRLLVNRQSSPLFIEFVKKNNLADYITSPEGSNHAVREACELLLGLTDTFDDAIRNRYHFSDNYKSYLAERQQVITAFYHTHNGVVIQKVKTETED